MQGGLVQSGVLLLGLTVGRSTTTTEVTHQTSMGEDDVAARVEPDLVHIIHSPCCLVGS